MKPFLTTLLFTVFSFHLFAQTDLEIMVIDDHSEEEFYSIQNKGWQLISYRGKTTLSNFSNKDYVLNFPITCKNDSEKPSFLIEFSNNYRDGNRGGMDFTSSNSDNFAKIVFLIDDQPFGNPFNDDDKTVFESFKTALKKGNTLTIQFFNDAFNPETGDDELALNRELDFMMGHSELLNVAIDCTQ